MATESCDGLKGGGAPRLCGCCLPHELMGSVEAPTLQCDPHPQPGGLAQAGENWESTHAGGLWWLELESLKLQAAAAPTVWTGSFAEWEDDGHG